MSTLHVLLPDLASCGMPAQLALMMQRGNQRPAGGSSYLDAVAAHFRIAGDTLPVAALMREGLRSDAEGSTWLCADLAYLQPDMNGVRMMACGNLDISREETEELARALRPLFGDRGCLLETTTPSRWHLQLPRGAHPPTFVAPDNALGDDLLPHLPQGPNGRRWRHLLNEAQTVLHQHPVNRSRMERGQVPANSVWFWGGGALPAWVRTSLAQVFTDQPVLRALSQRTRAAVRPLADFDSHPLSADGDLLLDLESIPPHAVPWEELRLSVRRKPVDALSLEFASGERVLWRERHRWRVWRRG